MLFVFLNFLSAISISGVAAYFSIIGLATIFPGSVLSVIVMGTVLEIGKLIGSVWLHKNWKTSPKYIKIYLVPAVVILSIITSMGIFGFLSKSHIKHEQESIQNQALIVQKIEQIDRLENRIESKESSLAKLETFFEPFNKEQDKIIAELKERESQFRKDRESFLNAKTKELDLLESQLILLDKEVDNLINSTVFSKESKLNKLKEKQKSSRDEIKKGIDNLKLEISNFNDTFAQNIQDIYNKIDEQNSSNINPYDSQKSSLLREIQEMEKTAEKLTQERFDLESLDRNFEAEIGPVKYISLLLKDFFNINVDTNTSVRMIIIILIFVFDPFAILLLISATISLDEAKKKHLPPDILKIREEFMEELEDYMSQGGSARMFLDRQK